MYDDECKKCWEESNYEWLYTYKNWRFYNVELTEWYYAIMTNSYKIDKRFKEVKEEFVYPKYSNQTTGFNWEFTETTWLEEHLCSCWEKFSFGNWNI